MKTKILFGLCLYFFVDFQSFSQANTNLFKWIDGANTINQASSYGASTNGPGARQRAVQWELNGKLYLFGGDGHLSENTTGVLNDLWVYDPATNNWTWLKGYNGTTIPSTNGVFGTIGVAAATNLPAGRYDGMGWAVNNKLYLMGGSAFNDLWEFDPSTNNWTWIKGSNNSAVANYGILGVESASNVPGDRFSSGTWVANGKMYLFGGSGTGGSYNDVWSYNVVTNNWTWIKGVNIPNNTSYSYGTLGVESISNNPPCRDNGASWVYNNKLYYMGGYIFQSLFTSGNGNDLWSFDIATNNWTWIKGSNTVDVLSSFGTIGVPSPTNTPASKTRTSTWTYNGKLYLFGGSSDYGFNSDNDLWEYNPATNNWTWIKGANTSSMVGQYGSLGVTTNTNMPGARSQASSWLHNNKFYLFGGYGYASVTSGYLNDLWQYDPINNNFTWIKGRKINSKPGIYNAPSRPGAREKALNWTVNDKFYLMGGQGKDENGDEGYLNDLWEYNPASSIWAWLKGSKFINPSDSYGTINVAATTNSPGGRVGATSWQYNNKLYLFGGTKGFSGVLHSNNYNDVWQYDLTSNNWTWIKGSILTGNTGTYGTINVPNAANNPASKEGAMSIFHNGKLYLFGGSYVYGVYGGMGPGGIFIYNPVSNRYNDFWSFDHASNNWTWIKGSNNTNQLGTYFNLFNPQYQTPGSREGGSLWAIDNKIYLFGGYGYSSNALGYLNDFWEYNISNQIWQWAKGSNFSNINGNYGTVGVPATTNTPGSRTSPYSWTFNNKIYLMGGGGFGASGGVDWLNDLWEFKPTTNNWTWLKGSFSISQGGIYGTQNVYNTNNIPGARSDANTWVYNLKLYQFGGIGYGSGIGLGLLNDLWEYTPACTETYSVASGNWNTASTWSCNQVPITTDVVNLYGHTVNLIGNGFAKNVIYNQNGNIQFGALGKLFLNQ